MKKSCRKAKSQAEMLIDQDSTDKQALQDVCFSLADFELDDPEIPALREKLREKISQLPQGIQGEPKKVLAEPMKEKGEFDAPEWKRYFEGKSIEEREKIKQFLEAFGQEESKKWGKAVLVVIVSLAVLFTVLSTCVDRRSEDKEIDQKHEIAEDIEEGKPGKRLSREADDLGEWGRGKYGMFPPSDDEVVRDLLRGYKKGEDVPMPSPERRKEIDKMIEDIFK